MDQNLSSRSGANVASSRPETLDFFEIAKSSQPYPVKQLLHRISALRAELDRERQQRKTEHKETEDKYKADLQLLRETNDNLERNFKQLQEKYKEDLTRTLRKVEYLEGDWTTLQTRASELRSDVDAFGAAASVRQITSDAPLQIEDSVNEAHKNVGGKELPQWQLEKLKLLLRQQILDERPVLQESDSAQVLQETREGLASIIADLYETTKKLGEHQAGLEAVQACQKVDYNATQSIAGQDMASSEDNSATTRSIGGTGTTVAGPQSLTNDVTTDAHTVSATTETPHKRTLSELLDDKQRASSVHHQRRRTGFASYVGLSNSAWQAGTTAGPAKNGFASAQGDFQPNPALDPPFLSQHNRSNAVWVDERKHTAPGPSFSTTKVPLAIVVSQPRALVSLPPSPAKESFRSPEVTSDSSEEDKASSRALHLRSNTQGQSPWKVPVGPRKWQNSAIRKGE